MVFHDPTHNRKTQSGSALLGREIRQEEPFLHFSGNAVPGVGNHQFDDVAARHR